MSAFTHAIVRCDYWAPGDAWPRCHASVHDGTFHFEASPEFPPEAIFSTKADVRRAAKKLGWTVVRSPLGRAFDRDFCPDHSRETD